MKRCLLAASLLAALPALAGPYDQVYSLITTDTARSADPNVIPVIVNRVDGETVMTRTEAVVAPGPRKVTIDVPPRKGFSQATQATFDLDAKPCTRYYLAARLDSPTTQTWKPIVRNSEPIGECRKKFKVAG
jgi:hypothetical protein